MMQSEDDPTLPANMNHFRWLRADLSLSHSVYLQFLADMSVEVLRYHGLSARADVAESTGNAVSVIIGNLKRLYEIDPRLLCAIPQSNASFKQGAYNPYKLSSRSVRRVIKYLYDSDPPYVEKFGGNQINPANNGGGYVSRFRSSRRLMEAIEAYLRDRRNEEDESLSTGSVDNPRITRNTSETDVPILHATQEANPHSIQMKSHYQRASLPLIRMKDEDKRLIVMPADPEILRMESDLSAYNDFLEEFWIDLILPDREFKEATGGWGRDENEPDEFGEDNSPSSGADILLDTRLYRVFNNSSLSDGGRFYGGWWQRIKSRYRDYITINGHTTVEIDFSNMQAAMLYAKVGVQLPEDAYQLDGVPPAYRKLIKRAFFKLINATGQIRAPRKDELPDGWTWEELLAALEAKHEPIRRYFRSGIGIRLQRIDADIAQSIMLRMMNEGTLVLPVHDSFIVRNADNGETLKRVMLEEYEKRMGRTINVDAEVHWPWLSSDSEQKQLKEGIIWHEDVILENISNIEYKEYNDRYHDAWQLMFSRNDYEHVFLK